MVTLFATAAAELMFGLLRVPDGITTLVPEVGTPHVQLEAVFQLVLVTPVQVPSEKLDIVIVSFSGLQTEPKIVHFKVAEVPSGTPVTVVVEELLLVIKAVPETTVQAPVPVPDAAIVKVSVLHWMMSIPAFGGIFIFMFFVIEVIPQLPPVVVNVKAIVPLSEALAV
jgi:hypothetical protein